MISENRVNIDQRALELAQGIMRGEYRIADDTDINDIGFVLNNDNLMDMIYTILRQEYGEEREALTRLSEFVNYNRNIINNIFNRSNNSMNNIIGDIENVVRPPRIYISEIDEPQPIEIPQDVISGIPEQVLDVITCPIGGEIMRNPVINSVGQTYDRINIQTWMSMGNMTDPITRLEITNTLIPNFSIKSLIDSYIPQLGGKRKYTKKNKKYKKSKKTKNNKIKKNMKKMRKTKTIKQKKGNKNKNHNKKTKGKK
jgi:hypothetical protein